MKKLYSTAIILWHISVITQDKCVKLFLLRIAQIHWKINDWKYIATKRNKN